MLTSQSIRSWLWVATLGPAMGASACLGGGVVAMHPEAQGVTVVPESEKPLHCTVVDDILGRSSSEDRMQARAGAENDLKNKAAALNSNYAVIVGDQSGPVGTTGKFEVALRGKAYKCDTEPTSDPFATPAPAVPEAGAADPAAAASPASPAPAAAPPGAASPAGAPSVPAASTGKAKPKKSH